MPARSVCLVTLSLSEAGPGRFGRQVSVTDIYHTIYHTTSPGVRHSRVQQNTSGLPNISTSIHTIPYVCAETRPLSTSQLLIRQLESSCNPTVASHQSGFSADMQAMKGDRFKPAVLTTRQGRPAAT